MTEGPVQCGYAIGGCGEDAPEGATFLKVPDGGALRVIISCQCSFDYLGHYVERAFRPHRTDVCGFCRVGLGKQWRYVYSVFDVDGRISGLLEIGAPAQKALLELANGANLERYWVEFYRAKVGHTRPILARPPLELANYADLPLESDGQRWLPPSYNAEGVMRSVWARQATARPWDAEKSR